MDTSPRRCDREATHDVTANPALSQGATITAAGRQAYLKPVTDHKVLLISVAMSSPTIPSFRQLLVFEAVARTENVSRAATEVHVSQPAVTQAIARLEREVGAALFRRRNTGCYLTEPGEILQRRTARLFAQLDQALSELGLAVPRGSSNHRSVERKLSQPQVR